MIDAFNTLQPALSEIGKHMSNGISLFEIGALSALTFSACYFVSKGDVKKKYIKSTINDLAIILFFGSFGSFFSQCQARLIYDNINYSTAMMGNMICLLQNSVRVGNHVSNTGSLLIHEIGHAAAGVLTYQNAHPKIELIAVGGGRTLTSTNELTALGKFIGMKNSDGFRIAAGALASVALANFGLFSVINFPILNSYLRMCILMSSIITIKSEIDYALSPLSREEKDLTKGHDFNRLWKNHGIQPLVSAVSLLSISIIPAFISFMLK